jgi:hypothetical protein
MSTPPLYVWVTVLAGLIGTTATVCVMLLRGALSAGLSRGSATRVAAAVGIVWAAWAVACVLLADADVYRWGPTKVPWLPIALIASLAAALLFTRVPVVSRIVDQPDALWRFTMPQLFRVVGAAFLVIVCSQQETIPHLVNRLDIDTHAAFDDVRYRYESFVPTIDFAKLTDLIEAGDLTRVQQYTAELAPHSFVNFWTFDPTPMMHLAGPRTRAITYMMGNNVIVETMFRHDPV